MSQFQSTQPTVKLPPQRPPSAPGASGDRINLPLILVALAMGLITAIGTNVYVNHLKNTINADKVTFYRLKVRVDPGDVLKEKDLEPIKVFAQMKDDYINNLHAVDPQGLTAVKGGKFYQAAQQGQLLTMDLLVGSTTARPIEPADGKRAVTLPIDSESAIPSLEPMSYIDLSAIVTPRGQRTLSMRVMERVRVLAVGDRTAMSGDSRRSRNYNNITVEVSPDEAQQLATIQQFAQDQKFRIEGRNGADSQVESFNGGVNPELLRALGLPVPTSTRGH